MFSIAAVFYPWFRWSDITRVTADGRFLNTTNLNDLLPSLAVGTKEAIGAQAFDGKLALWIGNVVRFVVIGIILLSFRELFSEYFGKFQFTISTLLLIIFLGLFVYVVLNNWMVDLVILKDAELLLYIIKGEWPGPTLLFGAVLLYLFGLKLKY
jgi:hypothetical protein